MGIVFALARSLARSWLECVPNAPRKPFPEMMIVLMTIIATIVAGDAQVELSETNFV